MMRRRKMSYATALEGIPNLNDWDVSSLAVLQWRPHDILIPSVADVRSTGYEAGLLELSRLFNNPTGTANAWWTCPLSTEQPVDTKPADSVASDSALHSQETLPSEVDKTASSHLGSSDEGSDVEAEGPKRKRSRPALPRQCKGPR